MSSITQADAHTSAASSRLNWHPHRFKWTRPFQGKTKSGFCAYAITFRTSYTPHPRGVTFLRNYTSSEGSINVSTLITVLTRASVLHISIYFLCFLELVHGFLPHSWDIRRAEPKFRVLSFITQPVTQQTISKRGREREITELKLRTTERKNIIVTIYFVGGVMKNNMIQTEFSHRDKLSRGVLVNKQQDTRGALGLSRPTLRPTQPPIQWVFCWSKAAGAWRWQPTSSNFEVKECVDLYIYSPPTTRAFMACSRMKFCRRWTDNSKPRNVFWHCQ